MHIYLAKLQADLISFHCRIQLSVKLIFLFRELQVIVFRCRTSAFMFQFASIQFIGFVFADHTSILLKQPKICLLMCHDEHALDSFQVFIFKGFILLKKILCKGQDHRMFILLFSLYNNGNYSTCFAFYYYYVIYQRFE